MQTHAIQSWLRPLAVAVLAVAAITVTSACSIAPDSGSTTLPTGQHLAASDFLTVVKMPSTIVLDVRTRAEYTSGRLPRAQNIDVQGSDFATRIAALDKKATYAVYCQSGKRSATALQQMTSAGFTHVYDLTGGIVAWRNIGGTEVPGGS
jgi:phage shock protein E